MSNFAVYIMGFLSGLLSLLTGGISNIFENGSWNNLGNVLNNAGNTANDIGNQNMLGNWVAKTTGSRLTDAEREANAFTAQREDLAWERQMQASNTSYQRQVSDMQAAGLNPMLALGAGGASSPSASTSGSVTPSGAGLNLGSLLQIALEAKLLPAKLANMAADTEVKSAEAKAKEASTELTKETERGSRLQNDYFERVQDLRVEGERLANDLSHAQWKEIYKRMDVMSTEMTRNIEQAHSEQEKQKLYIKQAILASEEAANIVYMRPFIKEATEAKSELDRKLANVAVADEAYRKGLMDNKVIEKSIEAVGAKISVDQAVAELNRVRALREKGDKHALTKELGLLDSIDFWAKDAVDQLSDIVDSIPVVFMK